MIEIELKITLADGDAARLRRHPLLTRLRTRPRQTADLLSIYYDTPDHALAAAGIALRLRKVGRRWVQTIKRGRSGGVGLFAHQEIETPAPGGRLALDGDGPDGAHAAIATAAGGSALSPVFETRVTRVIELLRTDDGSEVELALDRGEIVAGASHEAIDEMEIELVSGEVGAVYGLARGLFAAGPVRLATENKSARGYRLARGEAPPPLKPRNAGVLDFAATTPVETVARDVFRDCFAQISGNLVVVAESDAPEGPHQLRVGLRRLRTALAVFAPSLGSAATVPFSGTAQRLGRVVGRLRDLDVLISELVAEAAANGLDAAAHDALTSELGARREAVRREVRAGLSAPDVLDFVFDLGRFIETRGWLVPADHSQTGRLAAPISEIAPALLDERLRRVSRRGRRIRKLDTEALHEMRKDLKKLRYAADMLDPICQGRKVTAYIRTLKQLQDGFGSLTDAAMAETCLTGSDAPGQGSPEAQRAAGWVLGTLAVQVARDRPQLFERWETLEKVKPFWR